MNRNRDTVEETLAKHLPRVSDEQVDSAAERVLYRIHHAGVRASVPSSQVSAMDDRGVSRSGGGWWNVFAGVTAAAFVAVAVVLYFSSAFPGVNSGDAIPIGKSVRSGARKGAVFALPDGSRIEMRADSELILEKASDGAEIRLTQGSVIVTAAKQRGGHLYVRTRDLSVAVVGTIFMVSVEARGSQVGVIEGEVRVRHGDSEVSLLPGELISSTPFVKESLAAATLVWSRHASDYIALLTPTAGAVVAPPAQKPSFEVASIKRNASGFANSGIRPRGDRFEATNVTLKMLLVFAYQQANEKILKDQIIGAPGWSETDHFDLEAKIGRDMSSTPMELMRQMVLSLLEERFQLKSHREIRELPVYNLVLMKSGPKLSPDQTPPPPSQGFVNFVAEGEEMRPLPRGAVRIIESPVRTILVGTAIPISMVVNLLQGRSDRIILDQTNFKGLFDIDVQFAKDSGPVPPPETPIPSLFSAIGDLGLKLESGKAALPVVIVDRARPPSAN